MVEEGRTEVFEVRISGLAPTPDSPVIAFSSKRHFRRPHKRAASIRRPSLLVGVDANARTGPLSARHALLHGRGIGGARTRLAIGADSFAGAGVLFAFLDGRSFGRTRQWLAILAHRLALAAFLRQRRSTGKGNNDGCQRDFPKHVFLPEKWFFSPAI